MGRSSLPSEHKPSRIEDSLADGIADLWGEIDKKAASQKDAETKKNEALILEWAGKLAAILKGEKK